MAPTKNSTIKTRGCGFSRHRFGALMSVIAWTVCGGPVFAFLMDEPNPKPDLTSADHGRNSVESADQYTAAVQSLHEAEAAVVHARQQVIKEMQASPDYAAAVKDLDTAFGAYNDKKNALLAELEKKDQRYLPMKKQVVEIDAEIDAASQNPATTTEKFEELYKNRATFVHQWQDELDGAIKRENLEPLRQQWLAASAKLIAMQDQQRRDVENSDKLKTAKAAVIVARGNVDQARSAMDSPPPAPVTQEDLANDYVRRFPRYGFGGNDAWWTYGWSPLYAAKPAAGK